MKALVKHEVIGKTSFGDPEILVTVLEPHPKAGFQLLLRSTASMDHMSKKLAETGKTTYLVYPYPDPDSNHHRGWHGACEDVGLEQAVEQIEGYIDWIHGREVLREKVDLTALSNWVERFQRGLWETNAIDFEEEWKGVLAEVARVELLMKDWKEEL